MNPQSTVNTQQYTVNSEVEIYNKIKETSSNREQLKKVATEFEAIFITKMLNSLDNTVDRENGAFENNGEYLKNFKSYMYNEMGRQMAQTPASSFGFAKQIYAQMERLLPEDTQTNKGGSV